MITVCKMKMDATFEVWCLDNKNEICQLFINSKINLN